MIDNFAPLATHSGLPHLSNEQRDHFNKQKIQNMNAISPFFDNENYNKFFGNFDSFQRWRGTYATRTDDSDSYHQLGKNEVDDIRIQILTENHTHADLGELPVFVELEFS